MPEDASTYDESPVEVVSLDEAIDEVAEVWQERNDASDAAWDSVAHNVEGLGSAISSLSEQVTALDEDVRNSESSASEGSVTYVQLTDVQWTEMQSAWGWAKNCGSVVLFLCLVFTLMSAAILGSHLWTHFTRGWRN